MTAHLVTGLIFGAAMAGVAWAAGASPLWTAVTGTACGAVAYALARNN